MRQTPIYKCIDTIFTDATFFRCMAGSGNGDALCPCTRGGADPTVGGNPSATTKNKARKTPRARGNPGGPRAAGPRWLDARPDTADFRDRMFEPTLVAVPTHVPLQRYLDIDVPVLDKRDELGQAPV